MAYTQPSLASKLEHPQRMWELLEDWVVEVPRLAGVGYYTFAAEGEGKPCRRWLTVEDGAVTVHKGYVSDGCSMSPDFPSVLPGCVVHDAMRQAVRLDPDCPWTREESDLVFRDLMEGFEVERLLKEGYFSAVSGVLGRAYSALVPDVDQVCKV